MKKYFFIFLFLMPLASGIAVWPDSIVFEDETSSFIVYNNLARETYYEVHAEGIDAQCHEFRLMPNEQKKIALKVLKKDPRLVVNEKFIGHGNVINSVEIPLKTLYEKKNNVFYYLFLLVFILLIILGIFIYLKCFKK